MNRVVLTGRLTRDPEMRMLASGRAMAQFSLATNEYRGGTEKTEYHRVVVWERLAEICADYLSKGQLVAIEGRIQTRQWEDAQRQRHWRTEIVASSVEMLSKRRKRDIGGDIAADALTAQAEAMGFSPTESSDDPEDATEIDDGDEEAGVVADDDDAMTDESFAAAERLTAVG